MTSFKQLRFWLGTRITLTTNQVVRPMDDWFWFRPSGEDGPAGWWCVVQCDYTYSDRMIRMDPYLDGVQVTLEISPNQIESIRGATIDGDPTDTVLNELVRAEAKNLDHIIMDRESDL